MREEQPNHLLNRENVQLSNDRLLRVREEQPNHLLNRENVRNVVETFVKIGDTCIFKRLDTEKYLIGIIVQFSYLMGNKRERQYSSNYIDMSTDSFKSIGTFANWFMAHSGANDFVTFQRLDGIFIPVEKFICKIDEILLNKSSDCSFCISSTVLDEILPHWRISFTYDAEFVPQKYKSHVIIFIFVYGYVHIVSTIPLFYELLSVSAHIPFS